MEGDRRQEKRVRSGIPVTVESISATWQATLKNFSIHGLCYSLPAGLYKPPEGKEVFLTFSLLDRIKPIHVMGWIVHNQVNGRSADTGVTFMFLSQKDEEILRDFSQKAG